MGCRVIGGGDQEIAHAERLRDCLFRCAEAIGERRRSDSLPDDIRALVAALAAAERGAGGMTNHIDNRPVGDSMDEATRSDVMGATVDPARCPKCGDDNHGAFELCCDCLAAEVRRLFAALAEQQRETECARTALNEAFVEAEAEHADATARAEAAEAALADLRAKVEAVCARHEHGALRWAEPLPVPPWIAEVRAALAAAPSGEQRKEGQRVGICGNRSPSAFGTSEVCTLPHGHGGWHEADA
ncbi:MAG TPA: hypothetical protein VFH56_09280, partial [Acidimicrobiales bacterium]|nr:hypothetical protein [Acidimicrobiales bacterium]